MNKLHVYQWEKYDRPIRRWAIAAIFVIFLLWLSLSRQDWWGVILLIIVIGWYARYEYKTMHDMYLMSVDSEGLEVASTRRYRHQLQWFSLWFVPETEEVQVIYVYTQSDTVVYTLDDSQDEIAEFVTELSDHILYIKQPQLSGVQRVMRMLRI